MRNLALLLLLALLGLGGCAGLLEIQKPAEFRDGKVKEDPPGTMLPATPMETSC